MPVELLPEDAERLDHLSEGLSFALSISSPKVQMDADDASFLLRQVRALAAETARLRAERDAAWQAGAEAMREAAAFEAWERWNDADAECTPDYIADCIRALPIPDKEGA